jgi:hypothetical protein
MRVKHILAGLAFVSLLGSLGCMLAVAAGAGAGGYYYIRGDVARDYSHSLERCATATHEALLSLELRNISPRKDALKARFKARRANGAPVIVKLKRLTENSTQVRVRAGRVGDRGMGEVIHERIQQYL